MLWMVIERFRPDASDAVAARFRGHGRLLPDGVEYVDSWMTPDGGACFQIMRSPGRAELESWIARWSDLVEFEVHPVVPSGDYWAERAVAPS